MHLPCTWFASVPVYVYVRAPTKVGVHVTPGGTYNGDKDEAEEATGNHEYFAQELSKLEIAYLHPKQSDDQDERHGGKIVPVE